MRLQNSMCYKNGICLFCSTSAASARALGCAGCSSPRPVGTRCGGIRSWERWEEATGGPQSQGCCLQPSTLLPSLWVFATCGRSAAAAACLAQWVSFRMDKTSIPACLQLSPHEKSTDSVVHAPAAGSELCWEEAGLPSTGWQLPCSPLSEIGNYKAQTGILSEYTQITISHLAAAFWGDLVKHHLWLWWKEA